MFSPGIWWIGSRMKRSGSEVRTLQMYSQGVRPPRVLMRRAKLWAASRGNGVLATIGTLAKVAGVLFSG